MRSPACAVVVLVLVLEIIAVAVVVVILVIEFVTVAVTVANVVVGIQALLLSSGLGFKFRVVDRVAGLRICILGLRV